MLKAFKSFSEMSRIFVIRLPHFAGNRPLLIPACTAWRETPSFFAASVMVKDFLGVVFFIGADDITGGLLIV